MPQWYIDASGFSAEVQAIVREQMMLYDMETTNEIDYPVEQPELSDSGSASDDQQMVVREVRPRRAAGGGVGTGAASSSSSAGGGATPGSGRRRRVGISARERNLRRLESNERERMRMHSLNRAFEGLRHVIPNMKKPSKNLSKLDTLLLATNYVKALTSLVFKLDNGQLCFRCSGLEERMLEPVVVVFRNEQNNNILDNDDQEVIRRPY